jgi:hypothetical protein
MRSWALLLLVCLCGCPATDGDDVGDDVGDDDGPSGGWTEATASAAFGPRRDMGTVVHGGELWLAGGVDPASQSYADVWHSADGATWTNATASAAFGARSRSRMLSHAGKLWLIGGIEQGQSVDDTVWSSTDGATWTLVGAVGADVQAAIVRAGSMWSFSGGGSIRSSTDGVTWTPVAQNVEAITGRGNFAVVEHDGKLWIAGGTSGGGYAMNVWSSTDGVSWSLVTLAPAWTWKVGQSLVSAGGRMWYVGGSTYAAVWSSEDGATWTLEEEDAAWYDRTEHGVLVIDDVIWVIAGRGDGGFPPPTFSDVWSMEVAP